MAQAPWMIVFPAMKTFRQMSTPECISIEIHQTPHASVPVFPQETHSLGVFPSHHSHVPLVRHLLPDKIFRLAGKCPFQHSMWQSLAMVWMAVT